MVMAATTRRDTIREAVERDGYVSLGSLSEAFGVAPITIHRDLEKLEEEGALERIHGGARSIRRWQPIRTDFAARETQMQQQKNAIARRAVEEIPDGATIFIDSSTTGLAIGPYLEQDHARGLTVVTNSPTLASRLVAPLSHVIVLPGELNQSLRAVTGRWTVEFIEQLSFNISFVSAAGMTRESGLMTTQRELAEVARAALRRTERGIALIDSSKFGVTALLTLAPMDDLSLVITDGGLDDAAVQGYRDAGVNLVRATEE